MENALVLIDLLGFRHMVKEDPQEARRILNDFYNIAFDVIKNVQDIKGHLFSDTLIAYSEDRTLLVNKICEIYRQCFRKNSEYTNKKDFFLIPRGGISIGIVNIESRTEAPNLQKNFIVSPALVHSAEMEKCLKGSRLLIAVKSNSYQDMQITWNMGINSILYPQELDLWDSYTYKDALWFADLSKEMLERKKETEELILIAIELIKKNRSNLKVLDQYMDTLRIGLLSYSHLYQAPLSSSILDPLMEEFIEDKYWKIWLSLFEAAMQSPDNWVIAGKANFIKFYKKICLSKGWSMLVQEINKPSGAYSRKMLQKFVEEMKVFTDEQ